jgi:hypothetical protein
MRDRLIELLDIIIQPGEKTLGDIADHLLTNGVIVPPCKVGDTVYYLNTTYHMAPKRNAIYEAKVTRIVTTDLGTWLVIQIRTDGVGCWEIPDIRDWGKTVFLTREEAEQALKGEIE